MMMVVMMMMMVNQHWGCGVAPTRTSVVGERVHGSPRAQRLPAPSLGIGRIRPPVPARPHRPCPLASARAAFSQFVQSAPAPSRPRTPAKAGSAPAPAATGSAGIAARRAKNRSVGGEIHVGLFLRLPPGLRLCFGVAWFFVFVVVFPAWRLLPALQDATGCGGLSPRAGGRACPGRGNAALAGGAGWLGPRAEGWLGRGEHHAESSRQLCWSLALSGGGKAVLLGKKKKITGKGGKASPGAASVWHCRVSVAVPAAAGLRCCRSIHQQCECSRPQRTVPWSPLETPTGDQPPMPPPVPSAADGAPGPTVSVRRPPGKAAKELDARERCTESSAGAQAIFFKSIFQETRKFFLGSIAAGPLAPGAPGSNPAEPSDVTARAETSLLSLSDALSDAALHFPVAGSTPEMCFKLIFLRES